MIIEKGYMLLIREGETHVTRIPVGNGNPQELLRYYEAKGFRAWEPAALAEAELPELPEAEAELPEAEGVEESTTEGDEDTEGTGVTGLTVGTDEDAGSGGAAEKAATAEAAARATAAGLAEKYQARPKRK